jgi:hypothetical protein
MYNQYFKKIILLFAFGFSINQNLWLMDIEDSKNPPEQTLVLTFTIPKKWHAEMPDSMCEICPIKDHNCKNNKGKNGEILAEKFFNDYAFYKKEVIISHAIGKIIHGFDELYMWKDKDDGEIYYLVNESKSGELFTLNSKTYQQSLYWNDITIEKHFKSEQIKENLRDNFKEALGKGRVVRTGTHIKYDQYKGKFYMDFYWLHQGNAGSIYAEEKDSFKMIVKILYNNIPSKKLKKHLTDHMLKEFDLI